MKAVISTTTTEKKMKRSNLLILLSVLLITVACQQKVGRFTINGEILEANEKTLYLDKIGVNKVETVDSVKLGEDGKFSLSYSETTDCFELYRLRIDKQFITLVVDSTETISVYSALPSMAVSYKVEGSEECNRLKDLVMGKGNMMFDIVALINGGVITTADLEGFSDELKESVNFLLHRKKKILRT